MEKSLDSSEGKAGKKIRLQREDFKDGSIAFNKLLNDLGVAARYFSEIDEVELEIFDGTWAYPAEITHTVMKEEEGEHDALVFVTREMIPIRIE